MKFYTTNFRISCFSLLAFMLITISTFGQSYHGWRFENDLTDSNLSASINGVPNGFPFGIDPYSTDHRQGTKSLGLFGSQYVDLGNPSFPAGSTARSMGAWAMSNDVTGVKTIFAYGTSATNQSMFIGQNGTTLIAGSYGNTITVPNFWTAYVWHHIALTYDGTTAKLYADGVLLTSSAMTWNTTLSKAYIGQNVNNSEKWTGLIDDVQIEAQAWSSSTIASKVQGATVKVAQWRMENNATEVLGITSTANYNPTYTPNNRVDGYAVTLVGSGQCITATNISTFSTGSSPFSISAWARTTTTSGEHQIFSYGTVTDLKSVFIGQSGTSLVAGVVSGTKIIINNFWTAGAWHHICLTYDGSKARLYSDGVLLSTVAINFLVNGTTAYIGNSLPNDPAGNAYWNGDIDDVKVFTTPLSAPEVQTMGTVPATPTALTIGTINASSVSLSWTNNASGSCVYYLDKSLNASTGFSNVGKVLNNGTSLTASGLVEATTYYFKVRAGNNNGYEFSDYTPTVSATTLAYAPTGLTAVAASSTSVTLNWADNSKLETGYRIERSTTTGAGYSVITTTAANLSSWVDTNLTPGVKYYYRVTTVFAGGNSTYSNEVNATTMTAAKQTQIQNGVNNFAFQYKYDDRGRMVQKKMPGADWVYMVYDLRDRLVMTQDGNQRPNNEWLITKYDSLNRPVITAKYVHASAASQSDMSALISTSKFCEYYSSTFTTNHGYSCNVFPKTNLTVLTVGYYDNYNFKTDLAEFASNYGFASTDISGQETSSNTQVQGHPTGGKINVLGTTTYLKSIVYYDAKYRMIQNIADNNKGGWDRTTSVLDFPGRVLNTKTTHHTSSHSDQTIARRYVYDHASRLKQLFHSVSSAPEVLLAQNNYNEIGQLVEKNLHCKNCGDPAASQPNTVVAGTIQRSAYNNTEQNLLATQMIVLGTGYSVSSASGSLVAKLETTTSATVPVNGGQYFQSVDYRYNIRGWLQSMNNSQLANDGVSNDDTNDLFGMELGYNNSIGTGNASLYNGNISAMKWSSNLALGTIKDVGYNYSYDALNRITAASYATNTAGVWANPTGAFSESGYQYDMNGNIKNLIRNGSTGSVMDNMTYTYNGNQLLKVDDTADKTKGFVDGANSGNDYTYDVNGNMVSDQNKLLTATNAIQYNHLNLPKQVVKNTNEKIIYTYDAGGRKLMQQVYNASGTLIKTTDYVGEFIYQGDTLQFINHEEGRIVLKNNANEYQYHLKDHLGNVRLTFTTSAIVDANAGTYETANMNVEQSKFTRYANAKRINATIFDHTNGASTGYSERLNGSANEKYGLARSISVMPGDVINTEVYAKYVDPTSSNWNGALTTLMNQIASNTAGVVVDGAGYSNSTSSFPPGFIGLQTKTDDGAPKAYLNWLVFDRNYVLQPALSGYKQITTVGKEAGSDVPHEYLSSGAFTITQPGYVYIYLSNENATTVEVYFDDFKVTQNNSPVVQQEDFYPFGLSFNSYQRENSVPQNFLYNGKEQINDLGIDWYDYGARMYMPEIGRWGAIDPAAEMYENLNPYHYVRNNPVKLFDVNGMYDQALVDSWKSESLHDIGFDEYAHEVSMRKEGNKANSNKENEKNGEEQKSNNPIDPPKYRHTVRHVANDMDIFTQYITEYTQDGHIDMQTVIIITYDEHGKPSTKTIRSKKQVVIDRGNLEQMEHQPKPEYSDEPLHITEQLWLEMRQEINYHCNCMRPELFPKPKLEATSSGTSSHKRNMMHPKKENRIQKIKPANVKIDLYKK